MFLFFPEILPAETITLTHDDNVFEASTLLTEPTTPGGPTGITAPAVQFDAPGTGVYALDSVSFHLLQAPMAVANPDGSPAPPNPGLFTDPTPQTYPVTVKIWRRDPAAGPVWVPGDSLPADLIVTKPGLYVVSMRAQGLTFTGSIRIAVVLRRDELVPIPGIPVHLGVDSDGSDSTPSTPFGHSYRYDSANASSSNPWIQALGANYGVRASVHLVPAYRCQGFLPPFDAPMKMATGGRAIPLKARLFDNAGVPMTRSLLASPPLVQLLYASDSSILNPVDATDSVVPAGRSAAGQSFGQDEGNIWSYNLKTNKDLPTGTYTVQMKSGDGMEYLIDPTCVGTFVIENPKPANASGASKDSKLPSSKGPK
jgi:hypothetical protein